VRSAEDEPTLSELLVDLSEKITTLVRQEVLLAKAEIQESVARLRSAVLQE
jgi:hypothetical protein